MKIAAIHVIPSDSEGIQPINNSIKPQGENMDNSIENNNTSIFNIGEVGTPPYGVNNLTKLQGKKCNLTEKNYLPLTTHNSLKKAAFTLAEVLITLGIIGVVAAITLPTIISNYKKQVTVTKLEKAYTTLNQAFKQSEAENESSEFWDDPFVTGPQMYFEKYFKPYLNGATQCFSYKECGYKSNPPYKFLDNTPFQASMLEYSLKNERFAFYLPDGTFYWIYTAGGSTGGVVPSSDVYIDINGGKEPNLIGKDVFRFQRVTGKGFYPLGYNLSAESINSSCIKSGNLCAAKIMQDGWKITYPF